MYKFPLLAILLGGLAGLTACSGSSATKSEEKKVTTLKVGDKAPELKGVEWKNGPPQKFEAGHVYVLEFWAIWCNPCIAMMPHLSDLQHEHKAKNLHIIPVTTLDMGKNKRASVENFVTKMAPKYGLPFAICDTEETDKDYREMAGVEGLPASFVVGKDGTIAYIGRPMFLDDVLPKVLAGTWKGQADADRVAEINKAFDEINERLATKPDAGVADLAAFEAKYPDKVNQLQFQTLKVTLLLSAGKFDQAKTVTETILPKLIAGKKSYLLKNLRATWVDPDANPNRKHIIQAVSAAEAILAIDGPKDPMALIGAAEAYFAAGDKAKAVETAKKAVENAEDADMKEYLQDELKKYGG